MSRVRGPWSLLRAGWDKIVPVRGRRAGTDALFVGRVAGEDAGYVGETGAEARSAGSHSAESPGAESPGTESPSTESPAKRAEEFRSGPPHRG